MLVCPDKAAVAGIWGAGLCTGGDFDAASGPAASGAEGCITIGFAAIEGAEPAAVRTSTTETGLIEGTSTVAVGGTGFAGVSACAGTRRTLAAIKFACTAFDCARRPVGIGAGKDVATRGSGTLGREGAR